MTAAAPTKKQGTWVTWSGKTAHAIIGRVDSNDVRQGGYPVACGRWAPDPMDGGPTPRLAGGQKRCARCVRKVQGQ